MSTYSYQDQPSDHEMEEDGPHPQVSPCPRVKGAILMRVQPRKQPVSQRSSRCKLMQLKDCCSRCAYNLDELPILVPCDAQIDNGIVIKHCWRCTRVRHACVPVSAPFSRASRCC